MNRSPLPLKHTVPAIGNLSNAKNVRVTVSFEGDNGVVKSEEQSIELSDASDVRSLTLDVKIALD